MRPLASVQVEAAAMMLGSKRGHVTVLTPSAHVPSLPLAPNFVVVSPAYWKTRLELYLAHCHIPPLTAFSSIPAGARRLRRPSSLNLHLIVALPVLSVGYLDVRCWN